MDPLFIEEVKFEKVARCILDQDATKWTKQILDEFFTEFPFFMSENVNLQYIKRDDTKGYLIGTITIGNNLIVPIIANNFGVAPFDVIYNNGIPLPLTNETLGALNNSKGAFKQVVSPEKNSGQLSSLFEKALIDLQPAGRSKTASVIDRISSTITKEHKKELLEKLADKKIQAGFENNNTVGILAKIAEVTPKPKTYFKDSLSKVLKRDISYLEKVSRFKYKLIEGNSEIYDPIITEVDETQIKDIPKIKAVGKDFEKKSSFKSAKGAAFEIPGYNEKLIIMNIDGERQHAYSEIEKSSSVHCDKIFGGEMPQLNDYGVWINGNIATQPFEIVGMIKSAQHYEVTGFDGTTAKTYIPLRSVDTITPHETYDNTYYIPTSYKFVKVGEVTEIKKKKEEKINYSNYYTKDDTGFYNLQGPVFSKYAELIEDTTSLSLSKAQWVALQCKASENIIEKMAVAPINVRIPFECDLKTPIPISKIAETLQKEYLEHQKTIKKIAKDLIKEASVLSDPTSVDAILALNMITKENILEFVHQLPTYEQVLSDLARLLLTVRLGFSTIPEKAVQQAMLSLSKVVEIFRGISKLEKIKS